MQRFVEHKYFDIGLEAYPTLYNLGAADAQNVHDSLFEWANFKIQDGQTELSNITEEKQVSKLLLEWDVTRNGNIIDASIVERTAIRLHGKESTKRSKYLNICLFF